MSKTIRLIDLLNKIANGEEVPKKIDYMGDIFEYYPSEKEYKSWVDEDRFMGQTLLFAVMNEHYINEILNETVEIIEEQKEIDIQSIKEFNRNKAREEIFTYTESNGGKSNLYCFSLFTESCIIPKINELVQAVKQLEKKIKEKE